MINLMIQSGGRPMLDANAGCGRPMRRERREKISTTLLGKDDGEIRCPRIIRIGFHIEPNENPLDLLERLLSEEGLSSPEDLRDEISIPPRPYICRPFTTRPDCTLSSPRVDVLRNALLLGLCTSQIFDPHRPVIWTNKSLSRRFELFDPEGFYA
jgi:hypothetical protein